MSEKAEEINSSELPEHTQDIRPAFSPPPEPMGLVETYMEHRKAANDPEAEEERVLKDSFQDSMNMIGDESREPYTRADNEASDQIDPELEKKLNDQPYWVQVGDDIVTQGVGGPLDFVNEVYQWSLGEDPTRRPEDAPKDWIDFGLSAVPKQKTIVPTLDQPRTMVGGFVRPISQFMTGFLPLFSFAKAATPGSLLKSWPKLKALFQAEFAGGVTDFAGFDPNDPNIANFIVDVFETNNAATKAMEDWLATDPNDTQTSNRLKNAIAGSLTGMGFQGGLKFLKGGYKLSKSMKDAVGEIFENLKQHRLKQPAKFKGRRAKVKVKDELKIAQKEETVVRPAADAGRELNKSFPEQELTLDSSGQPISKLDANGEPIKPEEPTATQSAKPEEEGPQSAKPEEESSKPSKSEEEKAREAERMEHVKEAMARDELKLRQIDASNFKIVGGRKVPKDPEDYLDTSDFTKGPKVPKRPGKKLKSEAEQRKLTDELATRIKNGDLESASDVVRKKKDLNFRRMNTDQEIKDIMETTTEVFRPAARNYKVTNADTVEMAEYIGSSVRSVKKMFTDVVEGELSAKFLAARHLLVESSSRIRNLAVAAKTGNRESQVEFQKQLYRHQALQNQISGIKTEIARTLQAMAIDASDDMVKFNNLEEIINSHGGEDQISKIAGHILELADMEDGVKRLGKVFKRTRWHKARSVIHEIVITGWLSGISTHVANFFGNSYALTQSIFERGIAGTRLAGKNHGAVDVREALDMVNGVYHSFWQGIKTAAKTWRTGRAQDLRTKLDVAQGEALANTLRTPAGAISSEGLELKGPFGWAADFFGGTLRKFSTDLLLAGDDYFKALNYNAQLYALAGRRARRLADGDAKQAKELIKNYIEDPPPDIHAEALEFARENTFTNQAAFNSAPDAVKRLIREDPTGLLKLYFPFIQTPLNITAHALHRMPVVNKFFPNYRAQLESPDAATRQLARAKSRVGGLAMMSFVGLAAQGYLTGAAPRDRVERQRFIDAGGQYNSIYLPGFGWMDYTRLGPLATTLGTAADLVTAVQGSWEIYHQELTEEERSQYDKTMGDVVHQLAIAMGHNLFDQNFLGELSEFIDMAEGDVSMASSLARKLGSSVIPLSSMHRDITEYAYPTKEDVRRDDFLEELQATINRDLRLWTGGQGEGNFPERDLMGEVRKMGLPDASLVGRGFDAFGNPAKRAQPSRGWLYNEIYINEARVPYIKRDEAISIYEIKSGKPEGVMVPPVILEPEERDFLARRWGEENQKVVRKLQSLSKYRNALPGRKKVMLQNELIASKKAAQEATVNAYPRIADQQKRQVENEMRFDSERKGLPLEPTTQPLIPN